MSIAQRYVFEQVKHGAGQGTKQMAKMISSIRSQRSPFSIREKLIIASSVGAASFVGFTGGIVYSGLRHRRKTKN